MMADSAENDKKENNEDFEAPTEINIVQFAVARAEELTAMARASRKHCGNRAPQQKLPIHMRRRAAGHDVKRLPRTMRDKFRREMSKSGVPVKTKRPSRRHRRKPQNLLKEYNRRQRKSVWLETHIWHAKRFHMMEKWGYKIPLHPNDKGVRAAYRSAAKYCMIHDISYMCCIELKGIQELIINVMMRLTSSELGPTIGAKMYTGGNREGRTVLYKRDMYPYGAICDAKFLWRAGSSDETTTASSQLWLWVHPAGYKSVWDELKWIFRLTITMEEFTHDTPMEEGDGGSSDKKDGAREFENPAFESVDGVVVTSLKDTVCRFQLTGPLSHAIMQDALRVAGVAVEKSSAEQKMEKWWQKLYGSNQELSELHQKQKTMWHSMKGLESPVHLPPSCVLGLAVRDPRISLPSRKTMVMGDTPDSVDSSPVFHNLPKMLSWSSIWDADIRHKVSNTKITEAEFNKMRANLLVPGSPLELGSEESRVPVLLVQRPGLQPQIQQHNSSQASSREGFSSGWDLIIPSHWAMAFWVALIYRGARAVGLRETHNITREAGHFSYPNNLPDTPAGREWELSNWSKLQRKFDKMPPAKRVNFVKRGSLNPYHFTWCELVSEWDEIEKLHCVKPSANESLSFYVMRSRQHLRELQMYLCQQSKLKVKKTPISLMQGLHQQKSKIQRRHLEQKNVHDDPCKKSEFCQFINNCNCLVPVRVTAKQRGSLGPCSLICIPTKEDLVKLDKDKHYGGPVEPAHSDPHKNIKTEKSKKREKDIPATCVKNAKNAEVGKEVVEVSPVPCRVKDLVEHCSRKTVGYVTEGGFTFGCGQGVGLGYVSLQGLLNMMKNAPHGCRNKILVRDPKSSQYRNAVLDIIIQV